MKPETMEKIISFLTNTAIIGVFTGLITLYFKNKVDRKIEKFKFGLQKDIKIFEKEKEALSEILRCFTEVYFTISEGFNFEDGTYRPISREYCNKVEQELSQYLLFVNDQNLTIIEFLLKIMKRNNTFVSEATGDMDLCFRSKDLSLFEFIYKKLTQALKHQLFEKSNEELYTEISIMNISYLIDDLREDSIIEKNKCEKYMYANYPILQVINNIKTDSVIVKKILEQAIDVIKQKESIMNYRFNQIVEITESIKTIELIKKT